MFKRILDISLSLLGIIFLSPIMSLCAVAVWVSSPGPILYRQGRLGLNRRAFQILKFRTMLIGAEFMGDGLFSYENDPRITRVGRILRRTSLDELPQLFNVLCGSMSIVGPRPPVIYELGPLHNYLPVMLKRFIVKPGITGLAQVSGRNHNDWDSKIELDNQYVDKYKRYGVLFDFLIIIRTLIVAVSLQNTVEKTPNQINVGPITQRALDAKHLNLI